MTQSLILKRAPIGWNQDDFDGGRGRASSSAASSRPMQRPVGSPWMWTLAFGQHEDRSPAHGYEATREAAMAAFAKNWRRE
jgi:hypothetical protein